MTECLVKYELEGMWEETVVA